MRLHVLHAVLVIATVLAQGIAPVTGLKTQVSASDAALWSETLTTRRSIGKRLIRIEEAQHRGDNTTGSSNVTWHPGPTRHQLQRLMKKREGSNPSVPSQSC
ncbi:hypothetical protein C6341_g20738 [Phytophthora cactorum]|nr:hypothetical protein C6341_g20738 [Phytophthora cactorum]